MLDQLQGQILDLIQNKNVKYAGENLVYIIGPLSALIASRFGRKAWFRYEFYLTIALSIVLYLRPQYLLSVTVLYFQRKTGRFIINHYYLIKKIVELSTETDTCLPVLVFRLLPHFFITFFHIPERLPRRSSILRAFMVQDYRNYFNSLSCPFDLFI